MEIDLELKRQTKLSLVHGGLDNVISEEKAEVSYTYFAEQGFNFDLRLNPFASHHFTEINRQETRLYLASLISGKERDDWVAAFYQLYGNKQPFSYLWDKKA